MDLLPYVEPLQGTDSEMSFSRGNTEPLVALPFGMAHWMLQNRDGRGWQFHPTADRLQGIRLTHQPSPWMGDYGAILIAPQIGSRILNLSQGSLPWNVGQASIHPHRMEVDLAESGVRFELAPTLRGAVVEFTFPTGVDHRIIVRGVDGASHFELREPNLLVGWTRGNSGGVPDNFATYLVARFSVPAASSHAFSPEEADDANGRRSGDAYGIAIEFGKVEHVTARIGTSFISIEQALLNLSREADNGTVAELAHQAATIWEDQLSQIQIETEVEDSFRTFYSCLYRTKLFPRIWHEIDADGNQVHFSPYDGKVHAGPQYSDTGFWDTFRTQHPLLTLLDPALETDMLRGWISAFHESGWLPQWPSPGHRVSMPGTHLDATIADAVAKGLRDFDLEAALRGMLRHADHSAKDGPHGAGRKDIENYLRLGYCVGHHAVSQTLDYAYDDWAIATVADYLGKTAERDRMLCRAGNYRKLYDAHVGFMRAREEDGTWLEPFDELAWGGAYCEGGPWQSSWAVQHDPAGLIQLNGGDAAFIGKLDRMLTMTNDFRVGGYGGVIHEMSEMKAVPFGQYAHSNQPVHHVLYLYNAAGAPWRCQKEVRRVMDELYTPLTFSGDEDNGEMAAWYVLSALGIYPHCPGRAEWALGSPLFRRAVMRLGNGRELTVSAPENQPSHVYVHEAAYNGAPIASTVVSHEMLTEGGELRFTMSDQPNQRPVPASARPSSLSAYEG